MLRLKALLLTLFFSLASKAALPDGLFVKLWINGAFVAVSSDNSSVTIYQNMPPFKTDQERFAWCRSQFLNDPQFPPPHQIPVAASLSKDLTQCRVESVRAIERIPSSIITLRVDASLDFDFSRGKETSYLLRTFPLETLNFIDSLQKRYPNYEFFPAEAMDFQAPNKDNRIPMKIRFSYRPPKPPGHLEFILTYVLAPVENSTSPWTKSKVQSEINNLMSVLWPNLPHYKLSYDQPRIFDCSTEVEQQCVSFRYVLEN